VQNGLVLVTQTRSLISDGKTLAIAVREASIGRMGPKVMTEATAILGLLPILALRLHGTEIERPLAIVMTGGLITSTIFTLLALPAFYVAVHKLCSRSRCEYPPQHQRFTCDSGTNETYFGFVRVKSGAF
jgi:heavy metal efflux system protein